jgi:GNAT superfamily N-acetyltransferase
MKQVTVRQLDCQSTDLAGGLLAEYTYGEAWSEWQRQSCSEALTEMLESDDAAGLIAYADGEPAGLLTYRWSFSATKRKPVLYIQYVFTASGYRRLGVATAMLREVEAIAARQGAHRLQLETDLDNGAARRLYGREGYEHIEQKIVLMKFICPDH